MEAPREKLGQSTGLPVRLITTFCWYQIESCILVQGVYTVTELLTLVLMSTKLVINLTGHPVLSTNFVITYFNLSLTWRTNNSNRRTISRPSWWSRRGRGPGPRGGTSSRLETEQSRDLTEGWRPQLIDNVKIRDILHIFVTLWY